MTFEDNRNVHFQVRERDDLPKEIKGEANWTQIGERDWSYAVHVEGNPRPVEYINDAWYRTRWSVDAQKYYTNSSQKIEHPEQLGLGTKATPILSEVDQSRLQGVPRIEETNEGQEEGPSTQLQEDPEAEETSSGREGEPSTRILGLLDQETFRRVLHGDVEGDARIDEELSTLIEKVEVTTTETMSKITQTIKAHNRREGSAGANPMRPADTIADQVRTLQGQNLYGQGGTPRPDHTRLPQRTFGNRRQDHGPPGGNPPARGPPEGEDLDDEEEDELQTGKLSSQIGIFNGDWTKAKKFQIEFGLARMTNPHHQNMRVPMQRVALALSYIKGEEVGEWSHEYADQLADEVYNHGVDPNNERLWDDFVLAFVRRFRDTGKGERAWAQLLIIEMKDDDLDGYIAKFESLLRKAGRDQLEAANVDIFKQGLKTWLFQMIMRRRPLPLTLDEWQWTARDEFSANAIIKATLGGGRAKGESSARQNYYAALNRTPKPSGCKPRDPDAMDFDAMQTSKLSKEERDKLHAECKCFNCKKKGHLVKDCLKKGSESAEQKDKGPQPRKAKGKKGQKNNNKKSSTTPKGGDPPSKKVDVVAAIRRMTAEKKTLAIEQLAGKGSLKRPITTAQLRMIAREKDKMHI